MNQGQTYRTIMAAAIVAFALARAATVALGAKAPASLPSTKPAYPVTYSTPSVEQITRTLDAVRDRLEEIAVPRIIDGKTKEPIADLSKPTETAILDRGPEDRFAVYSYPMGVIYSGMLACNEVTGDKKFADFVTKRFQFFADNLPALSKWPKENFNKNPFRQMIAPMNLDACGAMGAAMTRAKREKIAGPDLTETIDRFADYISHKQFRLEDGLLARRRPFPRSVWLDDAYMSVPMLAQYGKLTGDRKYFDDAAKQIKLFTQHLYVPSVQLYTHGMNIDNEQHHPSYFWGRANGWVFVATAELLDLMPEDHPDRDALLKIFRDHAKGLASCQSGSGLWHQLLDREDSYLETSCSAEFAYAMAKGVNRGWLDPSQYAPVAQAGWNGVASKISSDGRIEGTCVGTSYADDYIYYYHRPAIDDVHGYGPVLLAGSEMIKLVKNEKFRITGNPNGPIMYIPRAWDGKLEERQP